ncbi:neuromedin-U receptor 1 [Alosa sapidissima]|uniref:neuromedin-U receptor 1 n=1 Tax=Alosa sapidissima TaxID=34773 RepID=UPI001C09D49D|nr:neuromedin-U receptor 1 [Alosa sapidissima]
MVFTCHQCHFKMLYCHFQEVVESITQMGQFNCSSSHFLHHKSAWCMDADDQNCRNWNISAEDLPDQCLSRNDYLEKYMGARRSPFFLPVCVIYLVIFMVGALGNVLTCTAIARYRIMQTPTNYYLFSLAVSDLTVLLLGMPLELYEMWNNYPFLLGLGGCYFRTFLFETVCFASVLNVTALSAERYLAVVHPLSVKHIATKTHAKRVILALWGLSVICALPNTSLHGIKYLPPRFGQQFPESAICGVVKPAWIYNLLVQVTALVFFMLPMISMGVLYLLIGLQLYREKALIQQVTEVSLETNLGKDSHQITQQNRRHQQVTKMLCVLVVVFAICWAPFHIDRVVWSYIESDSWTKERYMIFEWVHVLSGVFFYLSSAVNPILYNLMSTRFREMFKEVMCQSLQRRYSVTSRSTTY